MATSRPYANGNPATDISTPPAAGPAIIPTVPRMVLMALAAGISSGLTSRGSIASSDGRWTAYSPALIAVSTKISGTEALADKALSNSAPEISMKAVSLSSTILRRSIASAKRPPASPRVTIGTSSAPASSPTRTVEWVSW